MSLSWLEPHETSKVTYTHTFSGFSSFNGTGIIPLEVI